jgi:hypothetical protein
MIQVTKLTDTPNVANARQASLVVIAHDVGLIELVVYLPALLADNKLLRRERLEQLPYKDTKLFDGDFQHPTDRQ